MEAEDPPLDELTDAVLDGYSVDWASAASSPGAPAPEVVRQLKVLAGIAELHRKLTRDTPVSEQHKIPEGKPERWGRLEILERIGQGSFGEVFRAWDSKLDREVAVKLLHAGRAQPEGEAVLKEARLLARVRHPNVAIVYDADEIDGRVGLWMEFIRGRNLEQALGERGKFDASDVTEIGIELCSALSAVHDAGLLHRDIKAQNLMQADDGRLVLMDFGTGRELEETPGSSVDAAGTPLYLAPEVFDGAQASVRTDIYSAGVLLFHLLTGAYPVRGATVKEVGEAHARGQRENLAARAPGVSKILVAAVDRAIEAEPSKRFESARDMLAALESVRQETQGLRTRRYGLALGAVCLAAIVVAVVPGTMRRNSGRDGRAAYFGSAPEKRAVQIPNAMTMGTPSPDGRYLPYSEAGTGNLGIYEFATGTSRVLTHSGDGGDSRYATESIVSADSSQVAYSWNDSSCDCTQLRVIDAGGANDRVLYGGRGLPDILPLEWSADGREILGTRLPGTGKTDVVLVSVPDGSVRVARSLPGTLGRVTLSPDGRYVAYDRAEDSRDSDRGIYLSSTDGGQEIPVATGTRYDSDPMWTPDGSGLVFSSTRTGGPGLWLQPIRDGRADGQLRLLDKEMGPFAPITLTRRGSLFYSHRTGLMDVYTVSIDPATGDITGEPANAATNVLGSNISADWSPDGGTLVFISWRTSRRNVLVFRSMETGIERELQLDVSVADGARWSPDGRLLAVGGRDRRGVRGLRLVDPETGNIVSTVPVAYTSLAWDLDGTHAYVNHYPKSVSRIDVRSGEEEVLFEPPPDSVPGNLSLSPDGRWIAFGFYLRSAKTSRLMLIPTSGGPTRDLLDIPETQGTLGVGGWTRDGRRVLVTKTTSDSEHKHSGDLWAVPLDGAPPRRLGLSMHALRDVRVSPDGTRVSFTSGYPDTDLWVFERFLPATAHR